MSRYYYFVSTLPALRFGAGLPLSLARFREECERFLEPVDLRVIIAASLTAPDGPSPVAVPGLLAQYWNFDRSLWNELAGLRAKARGSSSGKYLRPGTEVLEGIAAARSAFAAESPLEGERIIEKARWTYLEGLATFHYFDLETLVVYQLELLSLDRMASFLPDRGYEVYGAVYRSVLDTAGAHPDAGSRT